VRALRYIDDKDLLKNGLPRVSYGPWSQTFTSVIVGGPLALPGSTTTLTDWNAQPYFLTSGDEGKTFDATGHAVKSTEVAGSSVSTGASGGTGSGSGSGTGGSSTSGGATSGATDANVDLWDSGWPNGRYYWTVVPVIAASSGKPTAGATGTSIEYDDAVVPQDQCEAGIGMSFGKVSQPVVTAGSSTPWVSGLAPSGRVIASASKVPAVHDSPLVAWEPAVGATTYEVQVSRKSYPWKTTWSTTTAATSVVLPLGTTQIGTWSYRIRGINPALPAGAQAMSWSKPVRFGITGDSFVVVKKTK